MAKIIIHPALAERLDDALQLAADVGGVLVVKDGGATLALVLLPRDMAARIEAARIAAIGETEHAPCAA